jgi:hypothetical protein
VQDSDQTRRGRLVRAMFRFVSLFSSDRIAAPDRASPLESHSYDADVICCADVRKMPGSTVRSPWARLVMTQRSHGPVLLKRTASPTAIRYPRPSMQARRMSAGVSGYRPKNALRYTPSIDTALREGFVPDNCDFLFLVGQAVRAMLSWYTFSSFADRSASPGAASGVNEFISFRSALPSMGGDKVGRRLQQPRFRSHG